MKDRPWVVAWAMMAVAAAVALAAEYVFGGR